MRKDPPYIGTMTDKFVEVTRDVTSSAPDLFTILTDPARHAEIDGSGMLVVADAPARITAVEQTFSMSMRDEQGRPYEVVNHVVAFEPDRQIAWSPARPDRDPLGVRWEWTLQPMGTGTRVTQRCDWSRVTDADYLARHNLPRVSTDKMLSTIDKVDALAASNG